MLIKFKWHKQTSTTPEVQLHHTMRPLSLDKLNIVISRLNSGQTNCQISSSTGVSIGTISKIRSAHCPDVPKSSGGHPAKLSPANIWHAVNLITSGKAETAVQVSKALQTITNQPVTSQTVCQHLRRTGMKAVVKKKKPLLSPRHRKERMDFAIRHKDWTLEDWKSLVWSYETKINCLGSDGRKWAWKRAGEGLSDRLVEGTVKFGGGSVMVWGCMLWDGPGYACKIEGRMDGDLFIQIMDDELQESLAHYSKSPQDIIFQQDNGPKHTCKKAQEWFKNHGFTLLQWPVQSPDLNPIEHLWEHIKRRLGGYETPPGGMLELWERVEAEWDKIPAEVCQNLIESMPRRIEAVLKAKGGHTKY